MIVAALVALACTTVLMLLLRPVFWRIGLVDVPNERSSHSRPVLLGGGLAVAIGTCVGLILAGVVERDVAVALVGVSSGFAVLGFADDRRSRSVVVRLSVQLVLAVVAVLVLAAAFDLGPALLALASIATVAWIVAYVNVFNFMDGINGISASTAAIVGITNMVLGAQIDSDLVSAGGAALLGGAIGFLPFNFPAARIFAGDVGSYFFGSYIAVLSVIALTDGASVVSVAAPLMLYLFDTTYTLVRRGLRGKKLWESHREHSYQHLANRCLTHTRTTGIVVAITSACAGIGLLANDRAVSVEVLCLFVVMLLSAVFVWLPNVFDRRAVPRTAQ